MQHPEKSVPEEEVGKGLIKTSTRPYDPDSFEDEGKTDYEEGLSQLKKFENPAFGGLTLWLRKAATAFKMAADRLDYAEHLRGNTLDEYVEEAREQ